MTEGPEGKLDDLLGWADQIDAVLFDMDGTLVDSEPLTERAIKLLLADLKVEVGALDMRQFHGMTWERIAKTLGDFYPDVRQGCRGQALQQVFHRLWQTEPPSLVPGARAAVCAAHGGLKTGIVTSGQRESVEFLTKYHELGAWFDTVVCAEDVQRSKPDPQAFLLAAQRLQVSPSRCLVFEDSLAGLSGALAAGMGVVAVTHCVGPEVSQSLDVPQISDYTHLPSEYFKIIQRHR